MKIGIFGGAFNPVHSGHMKLACEFADKLILDKLLFIPTANPPHRSGKDLINGQERIKMLELAIGDNALFEVSDIEFRLKDKSYTYNTLIELQKLYSGARFYLIVGADQFFNFDKWYRYKDILSLADICTIARENDGERQMLLDRSKALEGLDMSRFHLSDANAYKVSSSQIRQMIKNGEDCSAYLPEPVYDYIKEKEFYIV